KGYCVKTNNPQLDALQLEGKPLVEVDPKYFRPAEVEQLLGNPAKAKAKLGWNPQKTSFPELVSIMVQHDMKKVKKMFLKAQLDKEEDA
ncbi:MAG: GDP-mannose 4,6-dehydratase, partial [Prevotella sp.]|nr:GDP-mannose 4,6-dehydratase [Prevotella sp.]